MSKNQAEVEELLLFLVGKKTNASEQGLNQWPHSPPTGGEDELIQISKTTRKTDIIRETYV